jgi:hypothetical protein
MDFFFWGDRRTEKGLGWGKDETLDSEIRACHDGIRINEAEYLQSGDFTTEIWRPFKDGKNVYKGTFSIDRQSIESWHKKYGFYTTPTGYKEIIIPVVLFTKIPTKHG